MLIAGLSGMPASRITWGEHLGAASSYIVLQLIDMAEGHTQQGPDGLEQSRVQIDCFAPDYLGARDLGRDVKALLDFHRGGGFRGIFFDGLRMTRESDENEGEAIYRASLDFLTHWRKNDG